MTTAQSNGNIRIEWNKTLAAIEGSEVMSHPDDVIKVISKGGTFDETKPAGRAPRCEDTLTKRGITASRDEQERRNVFSFMWPRLCCCIYISITRSIGESWEFFRARPGG